MNSITYSTARTTKDLDGILRLQKANLARGLSREEIESQGFVTVDHSFDQMKKLNDAENHVIAKDGEKVVAYLLAMTKDCRNDIPILIPMFEVFDSITYDHKRISDYNYLVVGQVCVDKAYRGMGILDSSYKKYREQFSPKYDFAITEIASTNARSRKGHKRIGFQEIHSYFGPDKTEWIVVLWDWS